MEDQCRSTQLPRMLFTCLGGHLALPDKGSVLVSRENGGNLLVNPLRDVWERGELTLVELTQWSFLVASAGQAMLKAVPQLEGGCINYWEAGNWALNFEAEPKGAKNAKEFRKMHLHLLGRSRSSTDPSWKWGESPKFPMFIDKHVYSATYERLSSAECLLIVTQTEKLL